MVNALALGVTDVLVAINAAFHQLSLSPFPNLPPRSDSLADRVEFVHYVGRIGVGLFLP